MPDSRQQLFTKNFTLITAASFFVSWSLYITLTIFPLFLMDELQVRGTISGIILALFSLGALLCRPLAGWLSDSFPKRKIAFLSITSLLITSIGYFFFTDIYALAVCRLLQGFSFSIASTILSTIVLEIIPEKHLGTGVGIYSANYSLAMIVGPMAGFFVFDFFATTAEQGYKAVFLLATVAYILAFLALSAVEKKSALPPKRMPFSKDNLILRTGLATTFCLICSVILYGLLLNYVALFSKDIGFGHYSASFYMAMGIGLVVSRMISGYFFDRGYAFALITLSTGCLILLTVYFINVSSTLVYFAAAFGMGFCYGIIIPSFQTLLVQFASPQERGLASSTYFIGFDAGIMIALFGGGVIIDMFSLQTAFYMGIALQALCLMVFVGRVMPAYKKIQKKI